MNPPLAGKPRSFGRGLLLTIVTFGIYSIYWNAVAFKEVYDNERRQDWPLAMFLCQLIPFLGIVFGIVYMVKSFEALNQARTARGIGPKIGAGEFYAWLIPGMLILVGPFIAYYKAQTSINEYWAAAATQHVPIHQAPPAAPQQQRAA